VSGGVERVDRRDYRYLNAEATRPLLPQLERELKRAARKARKR